jgi:hypothetical protein
MPGKETKICCPGLQFRNGGFVIVILVVWPGNAVIRAFADNMPRAPLWNSDILR